MSCRSCRIYQYVAVFTIVDTEESPNKEANHKVNLNAVYVLEGLVDRSEPAYIGAGGKEDEP